MVVFKNLILSSLIPIFFLEKISNIQLRYTIIFSLIFFSVRLSLFMIIKIFEINILPLVYKKERIFLCDFDLARGTP